jgi:hypothetical protein
MSGQATRKLHEATEAFMTEFEGARDVMIRIAHVQAKLSQGMDECLAEFHALFPSPVQQPLRTTNDYDNPPHQSQEDLPRIMQTRNSTGYEY